MSETLRLQVLELYQEVDGAVAAAGPVCVASGRCCRFKEYGHTLFLSNLEAEVLLRDAPAYDPGTVTPDFCPFQQGNLCTARQPRPLGCRVYYCDPNYQQTGNAITEIYLRRLKELAVAHGAPWRYAPLHHFLRHPEEATEANAECRMQNKIQAVLHSAFCIERRPFMHWLRSSLATSLVCVMSITPAFAEDWPQWLGPRRDNSSMEKVAPWKGKLKVLWRKPAGEGNSSPVVAGGRVFLHAKVKDKNEEEIVAFDAKSGAELWRTRYERAAFTSLYGNGPRATPAVVDGRLYAFGITGVLTCLKTDNGEKVWQVDTLKRFGAKNLLFGMACSPLVAGERVLVNVGGKGASVVAFDRAKGEVAWKSMDDPASYSSPILFGKGAGRQVVFLTGANVASLNPADGGVFWRFPLKDALLESSTTPIRAGDLLLASSITYGSVGLRLETKDGKPAIEQAWKNKELTSYFSTPVAIGTEHIYMVTGTPPPTLTPSADLHCIEAKTGKTLWTKPKIGKYHASLMRTGDRKLLLLTDGGELALLEPDPKGYRELARSKVSGPDTWAHPALSGKRLYVRDMTELICLQMAP